MVSAPIFCCPETVFDYLYSWAICVHLAEKPVSGETEHLCLARMDLPLSLPDSPVAWWVQFIHSWVPLGFCSFPDYPEWLQASFNSPLPCPGHVEIWNTEDTNIPAPRSAPITVTCYYGILFSENTLIQKKKKLESSLFQLIHFIMSHWYVNFCFKLLKLILYWVAMIWGKMCYFCKWMSV